MADQDIFLLLLVDPDTLGGGRELLPGVSSFFCRMRRAMLLRTFLVVIDLWSYVSGVSFMPLDMR